VTVELASLVVNSLWGCIDLKKFSKEWVSWSKNSGDSVVYRWCILLLMYDNYCENAVNDLSLPALVR